MLQNIVLYMTSTAAQVWAAIMIFEVVVMRELGSRRESNLNEQWSMARQYWSPLIANLTDPNGRTLLHRLPEFGLDRHSIHRVDTDKAEFIKFILAIKQHRLVMMDNKAVTFRDRGENLSAERWQAKFDPIAECVEKLIGTGPKPAMAFLWGCLAIVFNLFVMGIAGLWSNCVLALWATVAAVFLVNLAIGFYVAWAAYKAILQ